jgi:hypothetical protein
VLSFNRFGDLALGLLRPWKRSRWLRRIAREARGLLGRGGEEEERRAAYHWFAETKSRFELVGNAKGDAVSISIVWGGKPLAFVRSGGTKLCLRQRAILGQPWR